MREYKSREYCRDIDCNVQKILVETNRTEAIKIYKRKCKNCDAYKFHRWLQDNRYKIVKPNIDSQLAEICYHMVDDNHE